jgi:hypothetical protein
VRDGLLAQPAVYAADDAEYDRPRIDYGETKGGSGIASWQEGRSAGAGASSAEVCHMTLIVGASGNVWAWPDSDIQYALTCTHTHPF